MTPPPAPRRGLPPGLSLALRLVLVVALLGWIATRVDLRSFGRTLLAADPRALAAAGGLVVLGHLCAALRWHRLLVAAGSNWAFARSLAVYAAGVFLGLFIPTGVGGDVWRIARVRGSGAGLARGTTTILLERAIGLFALLVVGVSFVAMQPGTRPWTLLFAAGIFAGLVGLLALAVPGGVERLAAWTGHLPRFGPSIAARLTAAFAPETLDRLRGALPGTVLLSLVNHGILIAVNVVLARGLGIPVPWFVIAAAVPLVLLAAQIPITPGGLGVREAGYVFFLGRLGVSEEAALALALGWAALLYAVGLLAALGLVADRDAGKTNTGAGPKTDPRA